MKDTKKFNIFATIASILIAGGIFGGFIVSIYADNFIYLIFGLVLTFLGFPFAALANKYDKGTSISVWNEYNSKFIH
jgi:uncharacterized membrane protein YfcA